MKFALLGFLICLPIAWAQEISEESKELTIGIPQIPASPDSLTIEQRFGSLNYTAGTGQIDYRGDFRLRTDTGLELSSHNALFDINKGIVQLNGNVSIYQGGILQKGESASYDYVKRNLITKGLRISAAPVLLKSGSFETKTDAFGNTYFVGQDAALTTHDVEHPNFWIKADTINVFPDEKVTFRNLQIVAGGTPIFWLPYFAQPLNTDLGYHFIPGARSSWGGYLLNRYGMMVTREGNPFFYDDGKPWLLAQYHMDIRTQRGVGLGIGLSDIRLQNNPNLTGLKLYYTNDLDPQNSRSGIPRSSVNEDRYSLELKHRHFLTQAEQSNTRVDVNLTWMSDRYYREDFEPKLYRIDPDPDNTLSIIHQRPTLLTGITGKLRVNHFYDTDTSSPEVFFDYLKSPVFNSPLLYEGHASIGQYNEYLSDFRANSLRAEKDSLIAGDPRIDEIDKLLDNRGFNRFHTWHELSFPIRPHNGISIVPNAGAGYTSYWDIQNGTSNFDRTHLQAGVDASMKFSKRYDHVVNNKWGLDGLLHIVQPYASYTYLKSDALDPSFQPIQRLTPTTEVRPIKVGRFTAIDQLNDWSIMRLGVRNNLLTKRDQGTHSWLTFDTYIDMFLEDPELDREFSNLYNTVKWHPLPWVKIDAEAQFPFGNSGSGFSEYSTNLTYMPNRSTEIIAGYRYLDSHPTLEDSSRIDIRCYTRFNDRWGASAFQRWEMDDGTLESQEYSLHHDFGSWASSLGIIRRDNRIKNEFGVMLSFTLKEFPSLSIPVSIDTE